MDTENQIELLTKLGLTPNQAKTYLALARNGSSTAKQIAKSTGLACEVIYRAAPKLQELGLIEKAITAPTKFQATPIKNAVKALLERRSTENITIQSESNELVACLVCEEKENHAPDYRVILIPERQRLNQFLGEKLMSVKAKLDVVCTTQKYTGWVHAHYEIFNNLAARKTRVQMVIAGSQEDVNTPIMVAFLQNPTFKIKFINELIHSCIGIFDDEEVLISVSAKTPFGQTPIYWSNRPSIIALCQSYFEKYW